MVNAQLRCHNNYITFGGSIDYHIGNGFAVPPVRPLTRPADWSITPSPPHKALASRMPQSGTSEIQTTENPIATSSSKPGVVEADPVEFPITTVIIPIVVGLVAIILVVLGSSMAWVRIKRSGSANSETGRSLSIDDEEKSKTEALKTISNISNITTSSVDEDEHAISLQHWTSKKAVSNRYESWHIGEIDQEWVSL